MPCRGLFPLTIFALMGLSGAALAEPRQPVAIVEDATANVTAIPPFQLLHEGDSLSLASDQGIILSYLQSCQRESIRGGHVAIGRRQSDVTGGAVQRQTISCDPAALDLTPAEASQSAALAFRDPDNAASADAVAAEAEFVLASRRPVVIALDLAELTVEDRRDPARIWQVKSLDGVFELAAGNAPLDKGGVYRISGGNRSLVFRVGREATDAPVPLLKRLIRF
jgi:hypothetical protein